LMKNIGVLSCLEIIQYSCHRKLDQSRVLRAFKAGRRRRFKTFKRKASEKLGIEELWNERISCAPFFYPAIPQLVKYAKDGHFTTHHPLMTPRGRNLATFLPIPAL
jgi:hypothetical protein